MLAGLHAHIIREPAIFPLLRAREIVVASLEDRRGIGHRAVEPCAVKRIAEIVMGGNVALRPGFRVPVEEMHDLEGEARERRPREEIRGEILVDGEELYGLGHIRAVPVAIAIGVAKADIAREHHAARETPVAVMISACGPDCPVPLEHSAIGEGDRQGAHAKPEGEAEQFHG